MKYLKLFNESIDEDIFKEEILSHGGWVDIQPPSNENWDIELVYKISDSIYIDVIKLKGSDGMNIYLRESNSFYYINSYCNNYTKLFSKYELPYRHLSNYDRMMKICKYLLPFFEKRPKKELINDIMECFVEISDELIEPISDWGYYNNSDDRCFFPSYEFSDQLCLLLHYEHHRKIDFSNIEKEFNDCISRLEMFNIHKNMVEIINQDDWSVIIKIRF